MSGEGPSGDGVNGDGAGGERYRQYLDEARADPAKRQHAEDLANRKLGGKRLTPVGHRVSQTLRQEDARAGRLPAAPAKAVLDAQARRERRLAKRATGSAAQGDIAQGETP